MIWYATYLSTDSVNNTLEEVISIGDNGGVRIEKDNNTLINSSGESNPGIGIELLSSNNYLVNFSGISNEDNGIYIYGDNNTIINSSAKSQSSEGLYLWGLDNSFINFFGESNSSAGIYINDDYNNFTNSSGISNFSNGILIYSDYNNLNGCTGRSNSSTGIYLYYGSDNTIANSTAESNHSYALYVRDISNTFINNTLISDNQSIPLLYVRFNAGNNTFYWNNFTQTSGYYINNSNSTNKFNTTIGGVAQGNYYYGISGKNVYDSNSDGWGDSGSEYPLSNSTWGEKWMGYGSDYGPATTIEGDLINPTYSSVSHNSTYSGQTAKFSININDNEALEPDGQYIFSTNNTGEWVNDTAVNFTSTPEWANVTKTLNSNVGRVIGYRWYLNDSNGNINSTLIYKLITTEESEEEEEDEEDNDGGGGGSGGGEDTVLIKPAYAQIQNGYEGAFREKYRLQINLSSKGIYLAEINDIDRFKGNVSLSINNTNYSVILNESIKINLDNDTFYDLQVSVLLVTYYNTSRMTFKEIHEDIPSKNEEEIYEEALALGEETPQEENPDEGKVYDFKNIAFYALVGVIILGAIVISFFIIKRIKRRMQYSRYYGFYV